MRAVERVHIVGVGGAGMSGIATILAEDGAVVSGSDHHPSPVLDRLRAVGVQVFMGYRAENVGDAPLVARSRAIRDDNPEIVAARSRAVPVWERTDAMAAVLEGRRVLAVSGTHGKSSTTAMLAVILSHAGLDPGFLIGAETRDFPTAARSRQLMVIEADESDGTFVEIPRHAGIATNVEPEHLDHFGTFEREQEDFARFLSAMDGPRVVGGDDPFLVTLPGTTTYGTGARSRYRLMSWDVCPVVETPQGELRFRLSLPGRHFALNACGASALAMEMGVGLDVVAEGLSDFRGVGRRFEPRGQAGGVDLVDDYAHLPSEVSETLATARRPGQRLVVVFQPHLYSRTAQLHQELGAALSAADEVVVTDVFGAREDPAPGVTGELVARDVAGPKVHYVAGRADLAAAVATLVRPGDLVLTLGAGDIGGLADELLPLLGD